MARVVSVLLESSIDSQKRVLDINREGLIKLSFDRYLGDDSNLGNNILTNLDLVIRDADGGNNVLSFLQESGGIVRLRYGFLAEDGSDNHVDMSPIYILYPIRYKSTYEAGEGMISVKAIARQQVKSGTSYMLKVGTKIKDIVTQLAIANGWYIGNNETRSRYINVDSKIKLKDVLYKTAEEDDFTFIKTKLKPICESAMVATTTKIPSSKWECRITYNSGGNAEFYFRPNDRKTFSKRLWKFKYGVDTYSNVLSMTNDVDFSFLLKGLTVRIPVLKTEIYIDPEQTKKDIESLLKKKKDSVIKTIKRFNMPLALGNEDFLWNVELYPAEDVGDLDESTFLDEAIEQAIQSVSTLQLTIVGNPHIYGTDLIDLEVITRSGQRSILSSTSSLYWRVVGINEEIGLDGYKTHLNLVRERVEEVKSSSSAKKLVWVEKDVKILKTFLSIFITTSDKILREGDSCEVEKQFRRSEGKIFRCEEEKEEIVIKE